MGGFGISGQSISGGTKKKKYVDPRANATKAVYEKHLADQARRNKVASSTVPSDPALRGGPSASIASTLQSVADRAMLNQSARPVTTGGGSSVKNTGSGYTLDPGQRGFKPRPGNIPDQLEAKYGGDYVDEFIDMEDTSAIPWEAGLYDLVIARSKNETPEVLSQRLDALRKTIASDEKYKTAAGASELAEILKSPQFAPAAPAGADVTSSFYSPSGIRYGMDPGSSLIPTTAQYVAGQEEAKANRDAYIESQRVDQDAVDAYLRKLEQDKVDQYLRDLQDSLLAAEETPPPAEETPPPVGGDMGVVGGGRPLDRQIGIVEEALSEREAAIKDMVDAGVIDIQAAQALYDTERERVYEDFLAEQAGVMAGFESDMAAAQAERTADRNALNAQLIAAGIDPALVADEFAMMDATYQGGRDAERDYLDALGRIGTSADADRALLGEAVFGGFGQDLRSTGREMGLSAAMLAAQDRQTARERGLSSELLSAFTGVPEGAMFAGQYAGVDTPGIREGRLQRAESARQFDEALLQREAESALDRAQLIRDKAVDDERFRTQMMSQGIDPDTGLSLYDPDDPMKFLTPAQRFEAMKAEEKPLTTYFPMAIAQALKDEVIDENDMTTLSSLLKMNPPSNDAELSALLVQAGIPELMDVLLDMQSGVFPEEMATLTELATLAGTDDDDDEPFFMEGSLAEYIRREGWNPLGWDWGEMGGVQKLEELGKWAIPGLFRD